MPLHATAWLGALGQRRADAGDRRAAGPGRPAGAAVVHALAALPWVVLLAGVGFRTVEPELEESARLDLPAWRVWLMRHPAARSLGRSPPAALAVAVLTAGDMTVTDLLQVRTYAEEAYVQFTLGHGPADAAAVVHSASRRAGNRRRSGWRGALLRRSVAAGLGLRGARPWRLGRWRIPLGALLLLLVGNLVALPLYSLIWRAGRVGGRARLGQPPTWSLHGLLGTLEFAASESWEPLRDSLVLASHRGDVTTALAWALAWSSRDPSPGSSWLWRSWR